MRRIGLMACVIVFASLLLGGAAHALSATFVEWWPDQPYFCEPSGVDVDASGNIYVADTKNHRIVKLDPSGNVVAKWGQKGSGTNDFYYPYGVHVGNNGDLYVCDTGNCRIKRMTTSGAVVTMWGSRGTTPGLFDWPLSCCTDTNNYVYVTDSGQFRGPYPEGNKIQKFDANGVFQAWWGAFSESAVANGYAMPSSITYWPAQNQLFITDTYHNRVAKTDTSGVWKGDFYGPGDLPFRYPRGIDYTGVSQYFVISDTNHDAVEMITASGAKIWRTPIGESHAEGRWFFPRGIAYGPDGNVYVADSFNHRIQKLDGALSPSGGGFLARYGGRGVEDGAFDRPQSICVDSAGNVYVADTFNNRIQKFNSSGVFQMKFGTEGGANGSMRRPTGVFVDASGSIYVADTNNNRVQKFDASGNFLAKFENGDADTRFHEPSGVAVDSSGNIYVADKKNGCVWKLSSSGAPLLKIGEEGHAAGELHEPTDVGVDSSGNIYVADCGNHRIQKFSPAGTLLWSYGGYGLGNRQFCFPRGIGVDADGTVYVADTENNRVQVLDTNGAYVGQFGAVGSDEGQLRQPADVVVGSGGVVYVIERSNYRVSKFTVTP